MELHHLDWKKAETAGDRALLSIIAPTKDAATLSEQASLAFRRGDYVKVATITGFRMEDIYPMTQNLDEAWIDNLPEGVELSRPGPHRSTSAGDIIIADDGTKYALGLTGFVELNT